MQVPILLLSLILRWRKSVGKYYQSARRFRAV